MSSRCFAVNRKSHRVWGCIPGKTPGWIDAREYPQFAYVLTDDQTRQFTPGELMNPTQFQEYVERYSER